MSTLNIAALSLFVFAWIFYEPLLIAFGKRPGGVLNTDLAVLRVA